MPSITPQASSSNSQVTIIHTDQGPQVGRYVLGRTLGSGACGKVKLGMDVDTGRVVAIKVVRKDFLERNPMLKRSMLREIAILKVLGHANVVSLVDEMESDTLVFLVLEYVNGTDLLEYLSRQGGALPLSEALSFFQQLVWGLEHCHNRQVCHRDIKPENILLDRSLSLIHI